MLSEDHGHSAGDHTGRQSAEAGDDSDAVDPVIFSGTDVLTDDGDGGLCKRVHRHIYKAFDIARSGVAGEYSRSKGVDGGLNDYVGEGKHDSLQAGRKTNLQNHDENKTVHPPYWYEANWENPSDKKFGRGMKQFSDKETALKLAKIAAVADLISTISVDVKNETQSQKSESEKNLYQIVESVAKQNIDYNVVNSYFDEENCIAYVMVEMKE